MALESELQNLRKTTANARKGTGVKKEEEDEDLRARIEDLENEVGRFKKVSCLVVLSRLKELFDEI
jgi:hypothetical protein